MNPTDLERRALLALLEHGKGVLHTLTHQELSDRLGCNWEELRPCLERLSARGLEEAPFKQAGLTPEGAELARELQAAPERERQEAAEARGQRRNAIVKWLLRYIIAPVAVIVLASLLLRWLRVI